MKIAFAFFIGLCIYRVFPVDAKPFYVSQEQEKYISELSARASEKKLSSSAKWKSLMHFHDRFLKHESIIDNPSFFLSPQGKYDLNAELDATLQSFFIPVETVEKKEGQSQTYNHPQCLFPARFDWLNQELKFDAKKMPQVKCTEYQEFKTKLSASNASLIFTSAYIGNPASFFGHNLLRLDTSSNADLLSHAVNYGAMTGSDGGLPFMVKGVFGGYQGVFSVSPYYDTVNMYNNMENRDIWEYRLKLSPRQMDELTAHIWEVGNTSADYFFFSENCSYMLMEILDTVYPDAELAQNFYKPYFSNYVIPADTIRTFLAKTDGSSEITFRPSRRTKIQHAYTHLSEQEKQELRKILYKPRSVDDVVNSSLSATQKANVLETSYEFLQYQFLAKNIPLDEMRSDTIRLLTARNKITEQASLPPIPAPSIRPDEGHESASTGIYAGRRNAQNFIEYNIRPAYHTLLDETGGYMPFEAITYLDTNLRWYDGTNDLRLQKLSLVDIRSAARRNELFKPLSFQIRTGIESYAYPEKDKEGYVFYASGGIGLTYGMTQNIAIYGFSNLHGKAGGYLPKNAMAGAGFQIGAAADFEKIRLTADAEHIFYSDSKATTTHYNAGISFSLKKNWNFNTFYTFENNKKNDIHEWRSGIQYNF